MHVSRRYLR